MRWEKNHHASVHIRARLFRFVKNYHVLIIAGGALIVGGVLGASAEHLFDSASEARLFGELHPIYSQNNNYRFVEPLLGYHIPEATDQFTESKALQSKIMSVANAATDHGNAESVSVYFRDLTRGRWVGFQEKLGYEPASLLKVVIMIAYYKEAETNLKLLDQVFPYTSSLAEEINDIPLQTPSTLKVGESYTVEQLIESMITNSDNGAKDILLRHIDGTSLDAVYADLGLPNPAATSTDYLISPRAYSFFLRVLHNATYLNRDMSERALSVLAKATYHDGLLAGLPAGTVVAQKFGEHIFVAPNGAPSSYDLSNCGIIYHPTRPYILCIMTRGKDVTLLAGIIQDLSRLVYADVDADVSKQN